MNNTNLNTEITDFAWVISVLQSSEIKSHLMVSDKLFHLFITKWGVTDGNKLKKYSDMYDKFRFVTKRKIKVI